MNYYAKALDILSKGPNAEETKLLLFEIAKKNPAAVVQAQKRLCGPTVEGQIKNLARSGVSMLECIREYRNVTGVSLMEAKDAVEKIHDFDKEDK
jgi:ribosomal protein L7/L12